MMLTHRDAIVLERFASLGECSGLDLSGGELKRGKSSV
jgi:hypothetical protein